MMGTGDIASDIMESASTFLGGLGRRGWAGTLATNPPMAPPTPKVASSKATVDALPPQEPESATVGNSGVGSKPLDMPSGEARKVSSIALGAAHTHS